MDAEALVYAAHAAYNLDHEAELLLLQRLDNTPAVQSGRKGDLRKWRKEIFAYAKTLSAKHSRRTNLPPTPRPPTCARRKSA